MKYIEGYDSYFVWGCAALLVHFSLAFMQCKDLKWVPNMNRRESVYWYVIIWLIPIFGISAAKKKFILPQGKDGSHYDDSQETQDIFDK